MEVSWLWLTVGLVLAGVFGALAIYLSVYKTPASDKMIAALVKAAQTLLDAAVRALVKQMEKQNAQAIARDSYDPVPEARMSDLKDVADTLREWKG